MDIAYSFFFIHHPESIDIKDGDADNVRSANQESFPGFYVYHTELISFQVVESINLYYFLCRETIYLVSKWYFTFYWLTSKRYYT